VSLVDLFVVGAIVHFCVLGLHLVRYMEDERGDERGSTLFSRWCDRVLGSSSRKG